MKWYDACSITSINTDSYFLKIVADEIDHVSNIRLLEADLVSVAISKNLELLDECGRPVGNRY